MMPMLIVMAVRLRMPGVAVALVIISVIALRAMLGPWALGTGSQR